MMKNTKETDRELRLNSHLVEFPDDMTRANYESACAKFGVPCAADSELGDYGDKYGDYDEGTYLRPEENRAKGVERILRQLRWYRVRPQPKPIQMSSLEMPEFSPIPQSETVSCDCGHDCSPALVMSASMGTTCPDCYDRMAD